jgi:AraC family transcriptional activator of mtrCDE
MHGLHTHDVGAAGVIDRPIVHISPSDLDGLLSALDVQFVAALTECVVSSGYRLDGFRVEAPGLHYNLVGHGTMSIEGEPPIPLRPHTLVVLPRNRAFRIEGGSGLTTPLATVEARLQTDQPGPVCRVVAGQGKAQIIVICGFFHARYGSSTDLFEQLRSPIVEQFDASDRLDQTLKSAMAELVAQEVGSAAMSEALLKQVIVALVRRSLSSMNLWVERFAMLRDPQVARAFSSMAADPVSAHTLQGLARSVGLSRSAFMARFSEVTGHTPMRILRGLRMRLAAQQLRTTNRSLDEIVRSVGYESRSSFARAFRQTYGRDPSEYRASATPRVA